MTWLPSWQFFIGYFWAVLGYEIGFLRRFRNTGTEPGEA